MCVYVLSKECFCQDCKSQLSSRDILGREVLCLSMSGVAFFVCGIQTNGRAFRGKM